MKKFIITGGAGFIGSTLVKALLEKGAESILIIDDLSTGSESNISSVLNDERIEFINSRIEDIDNLDSLLSSYDFCYHLAAGVGGFSTLWKI